MEFQRNKYLEKLIAGMSLRLIKVITGIRRCGKSFLLNTIFKNYLLRSGIKEEQIIYFSFDNDIHIDELEKYFPNEKTRIKVGENKYVINSKKFRAYISDRTQKKQKYFLLLDEIQILDNFVGSLNGFLSLDFLDVYVTGSNSRLLSRDIETEFRGRDYQIHMLPLSFSEYMEGAQTDFNTAYKTYSVFGGIPLTYQYNDDEGKAGFLFELLQETYKKDILDRYGIEKQDCFSMLISILSSNIGSYSNAQKLEKTYKTNGYDYSRMTISKHIGYLLDSFILNKCDRFDVKGKKYISINSKYYFTDIGVRNAALNFRQIEPTHIMENVIYNELLFRGYLVDVGVVEKSVMENGKLIRKQYETDFVCNLRDQKLYIQSCYLIENEEKYIQESKSLKSISDGFKKIIVVKEGLKTHYNEDGILIMTLEDFLLGKEM